jgi:hypothetical protein
MAPGGSPVHREPHSFHTPSESSHSSLVSSLENSQNEKNNRTIDTSRAAIPRRARSALSIIYLFVTYLKRLAFSINS